jgi:Gpi18-like mannosyltransferase
MKLSSIIAVVGLWKVVLMAIVLVGISYYPFTPTFAGAEDLPILGPRWLTTWMQFDGVHFLTIAKKGYVGTALIQAFFPGYPLIVRMLSWPVFEPIVVGQVVSLICFSLGLFFLLRLQVMERDGQTTRKVLWLYFLFPTSFFFGAVYSEGLFFFLSVLCFYLVSQKHWFMAGVIGAAASGTRLPGLFLTLVILLEYFRAKKKPDLKLLGGFLPMIGLGLYMWYLWRQFGDPMLFYHVQGAFGASRETGMIVWLPQVIYRYVRMLMTVSLTNPIYYTVVQEIAVTLGGIALLILGWYKRMRLSYLVYSAGLLLLPTLTGNLSSMPRYVLVIFPFFMLMGKWFRGRVFVVVCVVFAILQVVNLLRFTQGLWVA